MQFHLKAMLLAVTLLLSLVITSCSSPDNTGASELAEIKQELAALKKDIANTKKLGDELEPEVKSADADDVAFEKAKSDGRVSAFGNYSKNFAEGRHLALADSGAWASAKRQDSVAAYEAYRFYFPGGEYIKKSYSSTVSSQSRSSEKLLENFGYSIADFPSFGTGSIDSDGNIELPSRDKVELEQIAKIKADQEDAERNRALVEEAKLQEVARQESLRKKALQKQALREEALIKEALREEAKRMDQQSYEAKFKEAERLTDLTEDDEAVLWNGPRGIYVINFTNDKDQESQQLDSILISGVFGSGVDAENFRLDTSTAAKWEKAAHEAWDNDFITIFNKWIGLPGFAVIADAKSKRILGCVNSSYTSKQISQAIANMSEIPSRPYTVKSTRCPDAHNWPVQ